jgi:hypothetical protein
MIQFKDLSDNRLNFCVYCGNTTETRDHVPSLVFLDKPYPDNLPVVPCCQECNNGFSKDEEYVACAVECYKHNSADISKLTRNKIVGILTRKESLRLKIEKSFIVENDNIYFIKLS